MPPTTIMKTTLGYASEVTRNLIQVYRQPLLIIVSSWLFWKILHRIYLYPRFFSPLRHIPGPSLGGLIKGQFPAIINGEAGIPQREWVKKYGNVVRVVGPIGIERLIFMTPEANQKILVSDWVEYPRPKFMRDVLGLVTGYGLLTVTKNEHKQMRRTMNPAFSLPNLISQMDKYYDAIESLIKIFDAEISSADEPESGKVLLTYEWMSKVALDIICETAFGYKTDSLHDPHNELAVAYERMIEMQSGRNVAKLIALVSVPGFVRFVQSRVMWKIRHIVARFGEFDNIVVMVDSMSRIRRVSAGILEDKMRDSAVTLSDTETKKDIMNLLVKSRKKSLESEPGEWVMTDEAMMDQVLTFLGAGHETTASGLAWTLYLLATHKDVQDKLREEIAPIFVDNPRPEYRTLKELQWLDCVVMESLRILPPVPMTFRQAGKTDYIDGVLVPEGTILYIPIRVINTSKATWGEDAEEFRPARWLNLPKNYHPTFSLMSFIAGPHACIGRTMSIIEMKTVVASLIANFEFEPSYVGQKPIPTSAVTMKPKDNMPLRVLRVNSNFSRR